MMEKKSSLTTSSAIKVLLAIIIIGAVVVLAFLLLRQSKTGSYNWSKSEPTAGKVQDLAKLRVEYQSNYRQLMQPYLSQDLSEGNLLSQELLSQASQTKSKLLGFLVPPEAKEQHLSTILALDGVVDGVNKQNATTVLASLDKLKELAGKI